MGVVFKLRVLGILSSLLVSGGGVSAADLPSFSFKRSAGWLAYDWTGFYFGGHFGYAPRVIHSGMRQSREWQFRHWPARSISSRHSTASKGREAIISGSTAATAICFRHA